MSRQPTLNFSAMYTSSRFPTPPLSEVALPFPHHQQAHNTIRHDDLSLPAAAHSTADVSLSFSHTCGVVLGGLLDAMSVRIWKAGPFGQSDRLARLKASGDNTVCGYVRRGDARCGHAALSWVVKSVSGSDLVGLMSSRYIVREIGEMSPRWQSWLLSS
jgi:hypothetical protein